MAHDSQQERMMDQEVLDALDTVDDNLTERLVRVETMLYKLCLHNGVQPRDGKRLCDTNGG